MNAERLSMTKKCCLNCKEFPTYGSVCSPFDVDQAEFSCSGHLFDRDDLLRRATAVEAENAELRAQLEAQAAQWTAERMPKGADELQSLLNKAYRKDNDDAHAARAVMEQVARGGEFSHITADARYKALGLPDDVQMRAIFLEGWNGGAQARGGAVVVPELTEADIDAIWNDVEAINDASRAMAAWSYRLAVSRIQPIPASQVLQPGMVGVDAGVLEFLGLFFDQRLSVEWEPEKVGYDDLNRWAKASRKSVEEYRAQQAKGE